MRTEPCPRCDRAINLGATECGACGWRLGDENVARPAARAVIPCAERCGRPAILREGNDNLCTPCYTLRASRRAQAELALTGKSPAEYRAKAKEFLKCVRRRGLVGRPGREWMDKLPPQGVRILIMAEGSAQILDELQRRGVLDDQLNYVSADKRKPVGDRVPGSDDA